MNPLQTVWANVNPELTLHFFKQKKACKNIDARIKANVLPSRSQFLLSVVVVLYEVIANIELANPKLVIPEEIQI